MSGEGGVKTIQNEEIDLKKLLKELNSIDPDKFKEKENIDDIKLYFIAKDRVQGGKFKYNAYSPSISKNIQKEIKTIAVRRIEKIVEISEEKEYIQEHYNPSGQIEGVIEICNKEFIQNIDDLILNLEQEKELEKLMDIDSIHTYCFDFNYKDNRIIALRRFTKLKRLREGLLGTFIDGTFSKIKGELLGVDNDIDLVIYDDKVLILNHISLERIFDLEEQFKNEAIETISMIEKRNVIINFEDFERDVLDNIPAIKRLTKIKMNETLPLFFEHFDKVVEVSNSFGLGITFNADKDKIIYEDKSQLTEITLLMNDAYYKTLIGNQPGTDKLK